MIFHSFFVIHSQAFLVTYSEIINYNIIQIILYHRAIAFGSIVVVSEGFNVNPVLGNPFSNKKIQIWKGGADGLRLQNSVKKRVEGIYL